MRWRSLYSGNGNDQQVSIQAIVKVTIVPGTLVYAYEYVIYNRFDLCGYCCKTVNHAQAEYAHDEDSDGIYRVHVNTMERLWSLLRFWLRPQGGGVLHPQSPLFLVFFKFVYNMIKRGKSLLPALLQTLIS